MRALQRTMITGRKIVQEMNRRASQRSLTIADAEKLLAMMNELLRRIPEALDAQELPPAKRKLTGNHRLPDDWAPSETILQWGSTSCPALDLQEEQEKFEIHYQSIGGTRGLRKDWNLAFKSWLLNARKFASDRNARNPIKQTREEKRAEITRATLRPDADDPF